MLAVPEGWDVGLTHCPPLCQGELVQGCHEQGLSLPWAVPLPPAGTPNPVCPFPRISPAFPLLLHIWKSRIMSHQLPEMLLTTSVAQQPPADPMEKAPPELLHLNLPLLLVWILNPPSLSLNTIPVGRAGQVVPSPLGVLGVRPRQADGDGGRGTHVVALDGLAAQPHLHQHAVHQVGH